jgi:plasmid stability protein
MQAHSAPLGLAFYNANSFPQQYHGLFVAFHGSWNRSTPTGYKVIFVPLDAQGNVAGAPQDFVTGWLTSENKVLGRPVGLAVGPDGALYVSDDADGQVYRITYGGWEYARIEARKRDKDIAHQTLTLNIPDNLYQRLKERAEAAHRAIEEEVLTLVTTAIVDDEIPSDIREAVVALSRLNDEELCQAARSHLSKRDSKEIETLQFKRQREGLTETEKSRLSQLLHQYDKVFLVRAHALGLLHERGHDIALLLEQPWAKRTSPRRCVRK